MYMPGLHPGSMSWSIYQDFASAIRALGPELTLLTDAPDGNAPAAHQGTRYLRAGPSTRWLDGIAAPLTRCRSLLSTSQAVSGYLREQTDLDLLYCEIAYPLGAGVNLARRRSGWNGATVVCPMGEDILVVDDAGYGFGRFPVPRRARDWTLRSAAAIRCISPMVCERIASFGKPSAVVPLNVANATVAAAARSSEAIAVERRAARASLISRLGLQGDAIILSLGRLHPFKGIHLLVDAMAALPDAELLVAGPSLSVRGYGDYSEFLRQRALHHGVEDRVHLLGAVPHPEVIEMLSAADAVAVPSLLESLNRVCMEAAAAGTPFVVTDTTGISAFVTEDGVGIVVPPRDPGALATALANILEGNWRPDRAAAQRFVGRFSAAAVATPLVELFEEALS